MKAKRALLVQPASKIGLTKDNHRVVSEGRLEIIPLFGFDAPVWHSIRLQIERHETSKADVLTWTPAGKIVDAAAWHDATLWLEAIPNTLGTAGRKRYIPCPNRWPLDRTDVSRLVFEYDQVMVITGSPQIYAMALELGVRVSPKRRLVSQAIAARNFLEDG